jgi:hypothetical protein
VFYCCKRVVTFSLPSASPAKQVLQSLALHQSTAVACTDGVPVDPSASTGIKPWGATCNERMGNLHLIDFILNKPSKSLILQLHQCSNFHKNQTKGKPQNSWLKF